MSFIPIFVTNSSQTSLLPMVIPKFRSFAFSKPGTTAFSACVWSIFLCSSIKIMFKWLICKWDSFRFDQKIIYLQGIHWLLSALHLCSKKIWHLHQSSFLLYLYLSTDKEINKPSLTSWGLQRQCSPPPWYEQGWGWWLLPPEISVFEIPYMYICHGFEQGHQIPNTNYNLIFIIYKSESKEIFKPHLGDHRQMKITKYQIPITD